MQVVKVGVVGAGQMGADPQEAPQELPKALGAPRELLGSLLGSSTHHR